MATQEGAVSRGADGARTPVDNRGGVNDPPSLRSTDVGPFDIATEGEDRSYSKVTDDGPEIQSHSASRTIDGASHEADPGASLEGEPEEAPSDTAYGTGGDEEAAVSDPQSIAESSLEEQISLLKREIREIKGEMQAEKNDIEGKIADSLLLENSFSILVTAKFPSRAYFFAMAVIVVSLVLEDTTGRTAMETTGNRFGFPIDVTATVRIAQYIAILIAVFTQNDLIQALHQMNEGNDKVNEEFEHAKNGKWEIQIILRFVAGALGLVVTFLLIMQQDSVLELLLNFTALEFVANLDDAAFKLCEWGFFGVHAQDEAKTIAKTKCVSDGEENKKGWRSLLRPVLLVFIFVTFVVAAVFIQHNQSSGVYLRLKYPYCRNVVHPIVLGNGFCENGGQYNTAECGWDGGDCSLDGYPNCTVGDTDLIANGDCDGGNYNTKECRWDGGDCTVDGYPDCHVDRPDWIGDEHCHGGEYNTEECWWDGGDCTLDGYPDCHVDRPDWIGDGSCYRGYDTVECGWDEGDCITVFEYPGCRVGYPSLIGDGRCDGGEYNTEECGWDEGDCVDFNEKYPNCRVAHPSHIGDGWCNPRDYKTEECGWDGGDCKEVNGYPGCRVGDPSQIGDGSCYNFGEYNTEECGWDGGDCDEFNTKYPRCPVDIPNEIGNGECNGEEYNTEECDWDGGDCDEFNIKYPNCNVYIPAHIGDGECDGGKYNTEECDWDGGDCVEFNNKYPNCNAGNPSFIGDGLCNRGDYNTEECRWDGGDCLFNENYPDCHVTHPRYIGDGVCDSGEYNTEECGWDGEDCL